jgi:predicted AAA+ superfamily ATPase
VKTGDLNILEALIYGILYRDISERYNVRNRKHLEDGLILIAQSVGSPLSLRKISRILGIPFNTISKILTLFIEANLVHSVEKEGKASERKASPNKIYLADNGLFLALTENINKGALVENLVYLALKEKGMVRYHRANNKEVDFVLGKQAWEVKYKNKIDPKDISNLTNLRGYSKRTLITYDSSGDMDGVTLVPLWKFLLEEDNN